MLHLRHIHLRLVDDGRAVAQQIRVAGVAGVDIPLHEEAAAVETRLRIRVHPVLRLAAAETRQLDGIADLAESAVEDDGAVRAESVVAAQLARDPLYIVVTVADQRDAPIRFRQGDARRAHQVGLVEGGLRAGTENVPGIVGIGKAVQLSMLEMDAQIVYIASLRDKLVRSLLEIEGVRLNGHSSQRLPNNINVSVDFVDSEAMVINLDFKGIAISAGSSCTAAMKGPSHVLTAIGLSYEEARSSIRITIGKDNTEEELTYFLDVFKDVVNNLRDMSPVFQERRLGSK